MVEGTDNNLYAMEVRRSKQEGSTQEPCVICADCTVLVQYSTCTVDGMACHSVTRGSFDCDFDCD